MLSDLMLMESWLTRIEVEWNEYHVRRYKTLLSVTIFDDAACDSEFSSK